VENVERGTGKVFQKVRYFDEVNNKYKKIRMICAKEQNNSIYLLKTNLTPVHKIFFHFNLPAVDIAAGLSTMTLACIIANARK